MGNPFELPQRAGEPVARAIALQPTELTTARTSPVLLFRPGERVRNRRFGLGTVVDANGDRVTVDFDLGESKIVIPRPIGQIG